MENTPVSLDPQKSPKSSLKYLMILLAVLALGFLAYWLARGDFFKGTTQIEEPLYKAETALEDVEGFIAINESAGEDFNAWPLESLRESSFKVLDFDPLDATVTFGSEAGYGIWRALRADFTFELSNGQMTITDSSEASYTDINSRCVTIDGGSESCFEDNREIVLDVGPGEHTVKFVVLDDAGRSDEMVKNFAAPAQIVNENLSPNQKFQRAFTSTMCSIFGGDVPLQDDEELTAEQLNQIKTEFTEAGFTNVEAATNRDELNVFLLEYVRANLDVISRELIADIRVCSPHLADGLAGMSIFAVDGGDNEPEPVAEPADDEPVAEPIIEPLEANFDCRIITQDNGARIMFFDKSRGVSGSANVSIKFNDGTPLIKTTVGQLREEIYEIARVTDQFIYNVVDGKNSDSFEATAEQHCEEVQREDNKILSQPASPDSSPEQEDYFLRLNIFNALQANAFGSDMGIDWLEATPGSTVYFEAGCKAGEDKVMISTPTNDVALFDINQNGDTCEDETDPVVVSQCSDTEDNDNDSKTDFGDQDSNDPGCENAEDDDETDPVPVPDPMQCSNQQDDDSDGKIDFGNESTNDPGCESPEDNEETDPVDISFQCSDLNDNDNDGKIDHPADPGCENAVDNDETNAPPTPTPSGGDGSNGGGVAPQCNDGIDNDDDDYEDFGEDPGCDSPSDNNEYNAALRYTECSDDRDNDRDGFTDTEDPGCEDAADDNEENEKEKIKQGQAKLPKCLSARSSTEFDDIDDEDLEEILEIQSGTAYFGDYEKLENDAIFVGYEEDGKRLFKGDQPIRRDEAVKIIEIATCYPDYLSKNKKVSNQKLKYLDEEFKNKDYWATQFILLAAKGGIVEAKKAEFFPGNKVTRAEFLKLLMTTYTQSTGKPLEQCKKETTAFVDVNKGDWFCPYFKTAYTLDIVQGQEDKKGNLKAVPNRFVTRAEAATWLHNYFVTIAGENYSDELDDREEEREGKVSRKR